MQISTGTKIHALLYGDKASDELTFKSPQGSLRLILDPNNIQLWHETLLKYPQENNLLLACESDNCDLLATRLTWVVGSAIRPCLTKSTEEAVKTLQALGVNAALTNLAKEYCPGLGKEVPWAFYLDRLNMLRASPALEIN